MGAAGGTKLMGVPLGVLSLVTLTLQNSALTIVLHYSRISVPADKMYSAASAVLLNECLKGAISITIAFYNTLLASPGSGYSALSSNEKEAEDKAGSLRNKRWDKLLTVQRVSAAGGKLRKEIFSSDCWKLSIPACLYVIQNNLQFVAASNLDVPTFQVTYNLKILTTALFSVVLLRRRLTPKKWFALFFLAAGVGVVQLQSSAAAGGGGHKDGDGGHHMDRFKGLAAVAAACMTSGLAGVYFEMVLKGSKADLWIRNVQLSFFSLLPAAAAVFLPDVSIFSSASAAPPVARQAIFAHFGVWAWAVVLIQVLGGLVTALVIKFSDNIMKGFATSLAIVLSFCAGIILFDFQVTTSFLVGTCIVVGATYLYNQPERRSTSTHSYLPTDSPSAAAARHFIPTPTGSPGRYSFSQGSVAPQSSLRNDPYTNSPPSQRRAGAGAPSGSQTPDHIVGFQHGLGIDELAMPPRESTVTMNGASSSPNGSPRLGGDSLASAHDVGGVGAKRPAEPWVQQAGPSVAWRRSAGEHAPEAERSP